MPTFTALTTLMGEDAANALAEAVEKMEPEPTGVGVFEIEDDSGLWEVGAYFLEQPNVAVLEMLALAFNARPFVVAVMFSATLAFATPVGYQTNMMVYGPGGYKFSDYVKVGLPLNIIIWLVASALIPLIWPL